MARKPREYTDTGIYHVIIRGNNKQNLFFDNDDRYFFLKKLKQFSTKDHIQLFSYCLMNNHVHLLIGNGNLHMSKFIQRLTISYVRRFNLKYECSGHLFQGRFKSEPVKTDEQYKTTFRYILQNPEKTGLGNFKKYLWNSYSFLTKKNQKFISTKEIYKHFDSENELFSFISQHAADIHMEYENQTHLNDYNCCILIEKITNFSPHTLIQLSLQELKKNILILKQHGFNINQLSRVTGISRYILSKL